MRNCSTYIPWIEKPGSRFPSPVIKFTPPPHSSTPAAPCFLLELVLLSDQLDYLPVQSVDLRSGAMNPLFLNLVGLGLGN